MQTLLDYHYHYYYDYVKGFIMQINCNAALHSKHIKLQLTVIDRSALFTAKEIPVTVTAVIRRLHKYLIY